MGFYTVSTDKDLPTFRKGHVQGQAVQHGYKSRIIKMYWCLSLYVGDVFVLKLWKLRKYVKCCAGNAVLQYRR